MSFFDDLKAAGLQSFSDALNNPTFREAISPDNLGALPLPGGGDTNPVLPAATRRGWSGLLNTAADFYSAAAQNALNGMFGGATDEGPLPPGTGSGFTGGQCEGELYSFFVAGSITNNHNGEKTYNKGLRFEGPIESIQVILDRPQPSNAVWYGYVLVKAGRADFSIPSSSRGVVLRAGRDPNDGWTAWSTGTTHFNDMPTIGNYDITGPYREDGEPDTCGDYPLFGAPSEPGPLPDFPVNPGGNHPGGMRFGAPYLGNDGNPHVPFNVSGEGWSMGGSFNPATGEWDFGPPLPTDEFGNPIGDPNRNGAPEPLPDPEPDPINAKLDAICLRLGAVDDFPISVPNALTDEGNGQTELETIPQFIAYILQQLDAVTGQYPIAIEIEDTDPLSSGNQSQTIKLPNQSEAIAEMFGLAYEANTNSELAVNLLFRLIPELIVAKNSSLTTQDYTQAITNYLGFRTRNVEREINSNFNPLRADSLPEFLKDSTYKIQGVEDDDPHTLVEWLQQLKFGASIIKAAYFRGPDLEDIFSDEISSATEGQGSGDAGEEWETFVDALNRQTSNLTDPDLHARPRATSVEDVLNPGTVLPDRE